MPPIPPTVGQALLHELLAAPLQDCTVCDSRFCIDCYSLASGLGGSNQERRLLHCTCRFLKNVQVTNVGLA